MSTSSDIETQGVYSIRAMYVKSGLLSFNVVILLVATLRLFYLLFIIICSFLSLVMARATFLYYVFISDTLENITTV